MSNETRLEELAPDDPWMVKCSKNLKHTLKHPEEAHFRRVEWAWERNHYQMSFSDFYQYFTIYPYSIDIFGQVVGPPCPMIGPDLQDLRDSLN